MHKKRLEDALNAAKAIQSGFNLESSIKVNHLEKLYNVDCTNHHFEAHNPGETKAHENLDESAQILSVQFNQDLNILATGDSNGHVQLFDVFSGKSLEQENSHMIQHTTMPAISIKWHPKNPQLLYYASSNGSIMQFDRTEMHTKQIINENNETSCIDINDESCLVSVGKDHQIRLYDLRENANLAQFYSSTEHNLVRNTNHEFDNSNIIEIEGSSHSNRLFSVKFDRVNHSVFYTGGWDKVVKIWDKRTGYGVVGSLYGPLICGDGIDIKKNFLLTASWTKSNSLTLWDLRNTNEPHSVLPVDNSENGEFLYSAKFCDPLLDDNKHVLACGSGTKSLHLIDYERSASLNTLKNPHALYCLDTIYSGCIFACGSQKNFFVGIAKDIHASAAK